MPKQLFRRIIRRVKPETILQNRILKRFAPGLAHPSVWGLNRRSAATAMAIGLFWGLIPMPWQMLPAALFAIYFRANIAISMAVVWVSNPLTWLPLWWSTYQLGRWILGQPGMTMPESWGQMWSQLGVIWLPLYLGSALVGIVLSALGYFGTRAAWRAAILQARAKRLRRVPAPGC